MITPVSTTRSLPFRVGQALDAENFAAVRRRLVLDGCKWDPQVGDTQTLAAFPLILSEEAWDDLQAKARALSKELLEAEAEILARPKLMERLGLPRPVRKLFSRSRMAISPAAMRVMRFDFHFTTEGWKISEVNNDVPGGFTEASFFSSLFVPFFPGARCCGNLMKTWIQRLSEQVTGGMVALFAAPGFMEDQQVTSFLCDQLTRVGVRARRFTPGQIGWCNGRLCVLGSEERVDCAVRFYQAEWLPQSRIANWENFFVGGQTPVTNPGVGILGESKRFPLVWDVLETKMACWRRLLPVSRDPRAVRWRESNEWILKSAYCNNGDTVNVWCESPAEVRRKLRWEVALFPASWVAQRRFEPQWFDSPLGRVQVCLGVYTINAEPSGVYGRITTGRIIDYSAVDVAVLVSGEYDQVRDF